MIPLKECLDNYFQDGDLQRLAQVTLPTTKPKSPIEKEPFNPPVYMFFLCIGTKDAYNNTIKIPFNIRSPHKNNLFINSSTTYKKLLLNLLKGLFKNSEDDILDKTYSRDDIITVSIFARSSHTNKNNGRVTYKDYLVAAASYVMDDQPSCLLAWLGVIKKISDDFNRPKNFRKADFEYFQLKFRMGTFLLNICQILKSIHSQRWIPIVCQVYRKPSDGPLNFYKKQYFLQLPKSHELVYQQYAHRESHIIDAKELIWMALFHPLKYLLMFDVRGAIDEESIDKVLERGKLFFLSPKPRFYFDQKLIESRLMQLFKVTKFGSLQQFTVSKQIKDQFINEDGVALKWCINVSSDIDNGYFGSKHVLQNFFFKDSESTKSDIYFHDFEKLRSQTKDRSNFFFVMSKILFGNEVYHDMVRLYFYFLYKSLSQLHTDHRFFKNVMPAFSKIILERTYLAPDDARYGASLITDHLFLPKETEELYDTEKNVKTEYYVPLLRLLSESFLKHKFTGHWHDINVLSAMQKIDIFLLECRTDDVTLMNADYIREWTLKLYLPVENDTHVFDFNKFAENFESRRFIARVDNYNYVVLSSDYNENSKIIDFPSYEGENYIVNPKSLAIDVVIEATPTKDSNNEEVLDQLSKLIEKQFVKESTQGLETNYEDYVQLRQMENFTKLINCSGGKLEPDDPDYKQIGPMFTLFDFLEAKIDPKFIMPIVRLLDPWKELVTGNVFPITNHYTFRDLMTFRPKTWIRDQAILGFIRWLNSTDNLSQEYFCIDPATFTYITKKRSRIDSFLKLHGISSTALERLKKILLLLYTDNHYIVIEIDIPQKKVKLPPISCLIADPMDQLLDELILQLKARLVHLFIEAIFPSSEIIYVKANNNALQNNYFDCGIVCMQRLYMWKKYQNTLLLPNIEDHKILEDTRLFRLFALVKIIEDNINLVSGFLMEQQYVKMDKLDLNIETDNISSNSQNENANIFYTAGLEEEMETDNSISQGSQDADDVKPSTSITPFYGKTLSGKNVLIEAIEFDNEDDGTMTEHDPEEQTVLGSEHAEPIESKSDADDADNDEDDGTMTEHEAEEQTLIGSVHAEAIESKSEEDDADNVIISELITKKTVSGSESKDEDPTSDYEDQIGDNESTGSQSTASRVRKGKKRKGSLKRGSVKRKTRQKIATTKSRPTSDPETPTKSDMRKSRTNRGKAASKNINYAPPKKPKPNSSLRYKGPGLNVGAALNSRTADEIARRKKTVEDSIKREVKRLDSWFPIKKAVEVNLYEGNPYYFVDKNLPEEPKTIRRDENRFKCKLYNPCQLGKPRAKNEVTRMIEDDLKTCEKKHKDLFAKIENWIDKLKKNAAKTKQIIDAETKLQSIETKILLLNWELKWQPVFLPYDSIYALRTKVSNHHTNVLEYFAVVKNPDGTFREKLISKEWLKENLDPEFFNKFQNVDRQKGWVMFNDGENELLQLKQQKDVMEELKINNCLPIYHYKPAEDDDEIIIIRACLEFEFPLQQFKITSFKWAVTTKSGSFEAKATKCNIYSDCTTDLLKEAIGADFLMLMGESIKNAYEIEFNHPGNLSALPQFIFGEHPHIEYNVQRKRFIDAKDKKSPPNGDPVYKESNCGYLEQRQYFYFDLSRLQTKYYVNVSSTQICGIVWKQSEQQYYGLERKIKSDGNFFYKHVPLEDSWVNENIDSNILKIVKNKSSEDNAKFFKIPIGDSRPIQTSKEIKKNPVIEFKEDGKNTCAFTSLCSALHYMKFEDVSIQLDDYKIEFLQNDYYERFYNIMGVVTNFIQEKAYLEFRQQYKVIKIGIKSEFDLLQEATKSPDTLYHVVLRSSDGAESHAVCIYNNWIFDGNFTNALSLTKENLTKACDSEFIGIHYGYMYIKTEKK